MFQAPPSTKYDLNFTFTGIPVSVHPSFWVIAVLFGLGAGDLIYLAIWVVVVFISILIHELGHSYMMRSYGVGSRIVLYIGGGLAIPESVSWGGGRVSLGRTPLQQIMISLAGPMAGFLFTAIVLLIALGSGGTVRLSTFLGFIPLPQAFVPFGGRFVNQIIGTIIWVNIFWGLLNLMPVNPLDGGRIAQSILVSANPSEGYRQALWLSVIAGVLLGIGGFFLLGSIYMALLFGFLAFQSYQQLRGPMIRRF